MAALGELDLGDRIVADLAVAPIPQDRLDKADLERGTEIENPEALVLGAPAWIAEAAPGLPVAERFRIARVKDAPEARSRYDRGEIKGRGRE
jgi:hypothetical protein